MYEHDWVKHMKLVMDHGQPGDAYEVVHIVMGVKHACGGSCYVKTEAGYRSCHIDNVGATAIKAAPFKI